MKRALARCIKVVRLFRNTHVASAILLKEREALPSDRRTRTLKTFSKTRWNGASSCIDSCVENQDPIVSVFTREKMLPVKERQIDFTSAGSLAKDVDSFILRGEFWESLKGLQPIFRLYNRVISELEGDVCPLSAVLMYFTMLFDFAPILAPSASVSAAMRKSLQLRYKSIYSSAHVLSCILDPAIPHDRLDALEHFHLSALKEGALYHRVTTFQEAGVGALRISAKYLGLGSDSIGEAEGQLSLILANFGRSWIRSDELSVRNHPLMYWMIEGKHFANFLLPIAKLIFCLYPSSAGL